MINITQKMTQNVAHFFDQTMYYSYSLGLCG